MIVWPDLIRLPPAESEPVAAPRETGRGRPPPRLDAPRRGVARDKAPAVPPVAAGRAPQPRHGRLTGGILALLGISIVAHAAVIAVLAERWNVEGMEAATDAVSVEIVFEAPAEPPREPIAGDTETAQKTLAEDMLPTLAMPAEPPAVAPAESASPEDDSATREEPSENNIMTGKPDSVSQPQPAMTGMETPPPDAERLAILAAPPAILPAADAVPIPSPRPAPPVRRTASKPRAEQPANRPTRTARRTVAAPQVKAAPAPAKARNEGRKGGATRGEKAGYARRLASHVQRHKRYPRAARSQQLAGAASVSITIDRAGRVTDARLRKGSGHAVLDQEALATARRAAPYPRPPAGVGGNTINFTVRLDYQRGDRSGF